MNILCFEQVESIAFLNFSARGSVQSHLKIVVTLIVAVVGGHVA